MVQRRAIQKGSGLGTLLKIGLPLVTNMLGGSGKKEKEEEQRLEEEWS